MATLPAFQASCLVAGSFFQSTPSSLATSVTAIEGFFFLMASRLCLAKSMYPTRGFLGPLSFVAFPFFATPPLVALALDFFARGLAARAVVVTRRSTGLLSRFGRASACRRGDGAQGGESTPSGCCSPRGCGRPQAACPQR